MTNTFKAFAAIVLVGAAIVLFVLFGLRSGGGQTFGASNLGTVVPNLQWFTGGWRSGDNNSSIVSELIKGTCNITPAGSATIAATSTAQFYCSVIGARAGDVVMADLPIGAGANPGTGGNSLGAGLQVVTAYATTSDVVGFTIANLTGAATSSYPQATTSVEYLILR